MRHFYHRGSIPSKQRINTLRRVLERELGEEDDVEYLPLEDFTNVRVRQKRRVAFTDDVDSSVFSPVTATAGSHGQDTSALQAQGNSGDHPIEQQAAKIVDAMERDNRLMRNNPLSEQRRIDTLREMPESLTLKRTIRKKLVSRVTIKSRDSPISLHKRLKYQFCMSASKFNMLLKDMLYNIELWYSSIKVIEGHYGSGVATFFKFFRWLFIINCIVFIISHCFVVIPQILYDHFGQLNCDQLWNSSALQNMGFSSEDTSDITVPPLEEGYSVEQHVHHFHCIQSNFSVGNIFTGEGFFTNTCLYYGHYSNESWEAIPGLYYSFPMAYFFTFLFCYLFIFISLSVSMAKSYRTSFIETSQGLKNIFAHKIFCGWDFSIAKDESAELKSKSIFNALRELLSDDEKSDDSQNCKMRFHIIGVRISVHILTAIILLFTGSVMWFLLSANLGYDAERTYQSSMMMSLIVTIIMMISPVIFSWIIKFEEYQRPRTALYVTLVRTYLLSMVIISVLLAFWLRRSKSNTHECWETSLGQEVYRLILMDFFIAILGTTSAEFVRKRIYLTLWEKIGQPEFNIASNTLNLIYNETLFFVGFFFCPPVCLIILIKMFITFYIKKIGALRNCQPSGYTWRAAQTQTVFLILSFVSLLGVIIVYGYILMNVKTSDCGPFRGYPSMYEMILEEIFQLKQDHDLIKVFVYITKPGVVAGILIGMCVVVYYLRAQSLAQIHMVNKLRDMLHLEAKDKGFLLGNISKVRDEAWSCGPKRNCQVQLQFNKQSGLANSDHERSDGSYCSSSSTQKDERVSEWLLKSTRHRDDALDYRTSRIAGMSGRCYENVLVSDDSPDSRVMMSDDAESRAQDDGSLKVS